LLAVGIDWAEEFHDVALGRSGEGVFDVVHVRNTPEAVHGMIARLIELEPEPAKVRVVVETRRGLLVEALVDAGVHGAAGQPRTWSPVAGARRRRKTTPRTPASPA
jgi:hypothetical protein